MGLILGLFFLSQLVIALRNYFVRARLIKIDDSKIHPLLQSSAMGSTTSYEDSRRHPFPSFTFIGFPSEGRDVTDAEDDPFQSWTVEDIVDEAMVEMGKDAVDALQE